jgi:hypothetical protein
MDLVIVALAVVLVIGVIYFLLKTLPKTYHVILIWCGTTLVSMLTMGWCLNNEDRCRDSFIYTADTADSIRVAIKDLGLSLFGKFTRPIK